MARPTRPRTDVARALSIAIAGTSPFSAACQAKSDPERAEARPAASATTAVAVTSARFASQDMRAAIERARAAARSAAEVESAAAPSPSASAEPPSPEMQACAKLCGHIPDIGCGSVGACQAFCREYTALPSCRKELLAFLTCMSREPDEHWECDPAGAPAVKKEFCVPSRDAYFSCFQGRR